jgi:hypothetical protein
MQQTIQAGQRDQTRLDHIPCPRFTVSQFGSPKTHLRLPDQLTFFTKSYQMNELTPNRASQSGKEYLPWIAAIILWIAFFGIVYFCGGDWCKTGVFGDSFGVLNALVSALATAAAYKAFRAQQGQVEEQKREFLLQRKEQHLFTLMEEWRAAVRDVTYDKLSGQYAICRIENDLLGAIDPESPDLVIRAIAAPDFIGRRRIERHMTLSNYNGPIPSAKDGVYSRKGEAETSIPAFSEKNLSLCLPLESIQEEFRGFYEKQIGAILGHVFRLQATILSYIDSSFDATRSDDKDLQEQLVRLYKAQLSDPEMHLLLYYGLSHFAETTNLKQLLTKYRVFEALLDKGPKYIWHRIPEISYFETEASPS